MLKKTALLLFSGVLIAMTIFFCGCDTPIAPTMDTRPLQPNVDSFSFKGGCTVSQTGGKEPVVHYAPVNGWFGDSHPVYFNGKWYLYYLDLPKATSNRDELRGVKQGLVCSEDLSFWTEEPVSIDNGKMWFAIGNCIYDGKIYSLCGAMDENIYLTGGLGLSTSEDGKSFNWEGVVYSSTRCIADEFRDANIFYYKEDDVYILVHGGRNYRSPNANSQGAIYYSTTKDFQSFTDEQLLYDPGNVSIPECTEMFRVGNKFYISVSWGISRTGTARYFVADSPYGPYRKTQINSFSSFGLVTPNTTTNDEGKTFTFGWVPNYLGEVDGGRFQWGGEMALPLELYHAPDGESLYARPAFDDDVIRSQSVYNGSQGFAYVKGEGWSTDDKGGLYHEKDAPYGEVWLSTQQESFDLEMKFSMGKDCTGVGIVLKAGNNDFNGYEIFIDPVTNQMGLRNHLEEEKTTMAVPITIERDKELSLRVILDGNILEVYLNDQYTLTERLYRTTGANYVGLFSDSGSCSFTDIEMYTLRALY